MTRTYDQLCPVAVALDVFGDRWTIPLLRDLLWHGPARFNELLEPNPGLSSTLLSQRLGRLTEQGLVEKIEAGTSGAPYYRLTATGRSSIEPVIGALYAFGRPLLTGVPLSSEMIAYNLRRTAIDNADRLWEITHTVTASVVVADARVDLVVGPGTLRVVSKPEHGAGLTLRMGRAEFIRLVTGQITLGAAVESGDVEVEGDLEVAQRIIDTLWPAA